MKVAKIIIMISDLHLSGLGFAETAATNNIKLITSILMFMSQVKQYTIQ